MEIMYDDDIFTVHVQQENGNLKNYCGSHARKLLIVASIDFLVNDI